MNGLLLGVLAASLAGSLHCVGMCGGLAAVAVADGRGVREPLAYHGARGATYVGLGALAAGLGAAFDLAGLLVGVAHVAAWIAAAFLVFLTLSAVIPALGARVRRATGSGPVARRLRSLQVRALRLKPSSRALAIGALSGLLPCGWLWAFVLAAGGTGQPLAGAAVMAAFWLGTVPWLAAIGLGARLGFAPLARRVPRFVPVLVLLVSFLFLSGRLALDPEFVASRTAAASIGDAANGNPAGSVAGEPPACCSPDADASR